VSAYIAKSAMRAVEIGTGESSLGFIPGADVDAKAHTGLHPSSEWLLDLIYSRLPAVGFEECDLTVARFRMAEPSVAGGEPLLRAVRFEGQRLLESADAGRLLANGRRPLVDVAMQASIRVDDVLCRVPVRIALDNDNIAVTTGLGDAPTQSHGIHRLIVESVYAASSEPHHRFNETRLLELEKQLREQATLRGNEFGVSI
jgi:hypothetical protein